MDQYNRVLDIEKRFDQKISTSRKKLEKDYENSIEDLKIEFVAMKEDVLKQNQSELKRKKKSFKEAGEDLVSQAKYSALKITDNPKYKKIVDKFIEELI